MMNIRHVKRLIQMVSVSAVDEIEIAEQDQKIKLIKARHIASAKPWPAAKPSATDMDEPRPQQAAVLATAAAATRHVVTSPMVGRFYCGTGPASTLRRMMLGARVCAGEPLCVIEALKIPTAIEARHSGVVAEILCESGQAVEYGQPLLVIE